MAGLTVITVPYSLYTTFKRETSKVVFQHALNFAHIWIGFQYGVILQIPHLSPKNIV